LPAGGCSVPSWALSPPRTRRILEALKEDYVLVSRWEGVILVVECIAQPALEDLFSTFLIQFSRFAMNTIDWNELSSP
jgi:hypothetical protein